MLAWNRGWVSRVANVYSRWSRPSARGSSVVSAGLRMTACASCTICPFPGPLSLPSGHTGVAWAYGGEVSNAIIGLGNATA